MNKFIDYYKVLGVPQNASIEEIKKAYQKISKQCHPDMTRNLEPEEQKRREKIFREAAEAKRILANKEKRAEYDQRYQHYQSKQETNRRNRSNQRNSNQRRYNEQKRNRYSTNNYNDDEEKENDEYDESYYTFSDILSDILKDITESVGKVYHDVKKREHTISQRFKIYQKNFEQLGDINILTKGFIIFSAEIFYTTNKLKLKRNDDIGHYMMRNRGKAFIAASLAAALMTGALLGEKETPGATETVAMESSDLLEETQEKTITLTRIYTVGAGDTLSGLAEDANCTRREIKALNGMDSSSDMLYVADVIKIPYHIPESEIGRYTTVELYQNENLYDLSETYETTPETLQKLNSDTIIEVNGSYAVTTDTIVVPTFKEYDYHTGNSK